MRIKSKMENCTKNEEINTRNAYNMHKKYMFVTWCDLTILIVTLKKNIMYAVTKRKGTVLTGAAPFFITKNSQRYSFFDKSLGNIVKYLSPEAVTR